MACPLIPDCVFESIYALSPDVLRRMGVRLVLCDLDNTLAPYEESAPSPALLAWKAELEQSGITLFVVSNSRKSRRCPDFCAALGVPFVHHAGKPSPRGFLLALAEADVPAAQAVMVGDQIFTDIWGANRAGIRAILVKPMAWGKNPMRRVRYALEAPLRLASRNLPLENPAEKE